MKTQHLAGCRRSNHLTRTTQNTKQGQGAHSCTAPAGGLQSSAAHIFEGARWRTGQHKKCWQQLRTTAVPPGATSFFFASHFFFPASGQAVVSGVVPSPPRYVPSVFFEHRVQHSHRSPTFFIEYCYLKLSRFPRVNLSSRKSPYEFILVCTRGDSNSRN